MATIGELNDFGVADLIDLLSRRGKSGWLTIKSGGQEVQIAFREGRLIQVTSSDITLRLGRMLVRQGLIDSPRLLEALQTQSETHESGVRRTLGSILVEQGWVTQFDIVRCIEEQSIEALARVIMDPPGLFVFEPAPPRESEESTAIDLDFLLQAARERIDALLLLREQLPGQDVPLGLKAPLRAGDIDALDLSPPELMVIDVLRPGPKTLTELGVSLALDELSLGVAVLTLLERDIVFASLGMGADRASLRQRATLVS